MSDDPLSDVLRLAQVESVISGGFTASGNWSIRFPPPDKAKFFAVVQGGCRFRFDGEDAALRLAAGDVILLTAARGFVMASDNDSAAPEQDARSVFGGRVGVIVEVGTQDGGTDLCIGGHVRLHPSFGALLSDVLPPYIHVRGAAPEARALCWILDQLVLEHDRQPGAALATRQLAHLLFVQVLRAHLAAGGNLRAGWLRAATDPRLGPALRLMHGEPGRTWRLEELARAAAMSRTRFAAHFKAVAGEAPLTYLSRWRMRLAEHALRQGDATVAVLARDLGYASESAFSHAFKRVTGQSPRGYAANVRFTSAAAT